jgi:hypothetical protein
MGKINTSITIDPRIAKLAKKYAALDDRSFANYVERAVAKQVEIDQNLEQPATKAAAPATKTKAKRKA